MFVIAALPVTYRYLQQLSLPAHFLTSNTHQQHQKIQKIQKTCRNGGWLRPWSAREIHSPVAHTQPVSKCDHQSIHHTVRASERQGEGFDPLPSRLLSDRGKGPLVQTSLLGYLNYDMPWIRYKLQTSRRALPFHVSVSSTSPRRFQEPLS